MLQKDPRIIANPRCLVFILYVLKISVRLINLLRKTTLVI